MTADRNPADDFERFVAVFPPRAGGHDVEAARVAWRAAVARAPAAAIINGAAAYAEAVRDRPPRYVMSMRRWICEGRWRDAPAKPPAPALQPVKIVNGSREFEAWDAYWRSTRGKSLPQNRDGCWWVATRFPPAIPAAE
jgi:hypothetical protein